MGSIVPRPEIKLVQRPVVRIARVWLADVEVYTCCRAICVPLEFLAEVLLLVEHEVLANCDCAASVHTCHSEAKGDP